MKIKLNKNIIGMNNKMSREGAFLKKLMVVTLVLLILAILSNLKDLVGFLISNFS